MPEVRNCNLRGACENIGHRAKRQNFNEETHDLSRYCWSSCSIKESHLEAGRGIKELSCSGVDSIELAWNRIQSQN
jgi:hypothetical protein